MAHLIQCFLVQPSPRTDWYFTETLGKQQLYIFPLAFLLLWSTKSSSYTLVSQKQTPISHFCQYLPALQYRLNCSLFYSGGSQPSPLHSTEKKNHLCSKKSCSGWYGTIKIKVVRNGRTVKIHNCPSAKLISPLFGMSDVLFIFKLRWSRRLHSLLVSFSLNS